jgi:5-methylcytosine-specific restriction endonuclease McrA
MLTAFCKWLFPTAKPTQASSPRTETTIASPPVVRPPEPDAQPKHANPRRQRPKIEKEQDEAIRLRLQAEIQRKGRERDAWQQAAEQEESENTRTVASSDWRRGYSLYRRTREWATTRAKVMELAGYRCNECGARAEAGHHSHYRAGYGPSLQSFIANEDESLLVAICNSCHFKIHSPAKRKARPKKPPEPLSRRRSDPGPRHHPLFSP